LSFAAKLRDLNRAELGSGIFYLVSGIILFVLLPFTVFPPHLILIGILSIITAFSVFIKRGWAVWLVFIQFVTATTFGLWTVFSVGSSNWLIVASLAIYVILTWIVTAYLTLFRKT
jgi:hypothetical protein